MPDTEKKGSLSRVTSHQLWEQQIMQRTRQHAFFMRVISLKTLLVQCYWRIVTFVCRWLKLWIPSSSRWLRTSRLWKISWRRRRGRSSISRCRTIAQKHADPPADTNLTLMRLHVFGTAWPREVQDEARTGGEAHHLRLVQHGRYMHKNTVAQLLPNSSRASHHPLQGMALHQKVTGERQGPSNQAMSFLAQQRQYTNARKGLTRLQPRGNFS